MAAQLIPSTLLRGFIVVAGALAIPVAGAADRIVSGKWEAAMTTDGATRTVSYCVDAETIYHGETLEGVKTVTNEGKTVTTSLKSHRVGTCP